MSFAHYFYQLNNVKNKKFFKKTIYGNKLNVKTESIRRFKNISFNSQLFNLWLKKGYKLGLLKHYNIFIEKFNHLLINDYELKQYENTPNYIYILELLDTKYYYYKYNNLLKEPFKELEYIFDLKIKKLNKKLQKKYKKKYDYKIVHIHKKKRIRYILKLLYSNVSAFKSNKYSSRIFNILITLLFNTQELEMWERKINTYKIIYKYLNKNN